LSPTDQALFDERFPFYLQWFSNVISLFGEEHRDDLEDAFAWKEQRRLSQALTLQYDKVIFILEPSEPAKAAIGRYVTVFDYPDGRLSIRHNGVELAYRTFDKVRQVDQGAIADNKHLGAVLAVIRDEQLRHGPQRRSGPRRRDQRDARLFKVG
jgi:hypothetical protein